MYLCLIYVLASLFFHLLFIVLLCIVIITIGTVLILLAVLQCVNKQTIY